MMDIFSAARANIAHHEQLLAAVLSSYDPDQANCLASFANYVKVNGRVSVNLRLFVASNLLNGKRYQNMYDFSDEMSALSGRPSEDILQEKLQGYYKKRNAFDECIEHATSLYYGALNIGGVGASHYGEFCIILRSTEKEFEGKVVYLKGDSLNDYSEADGTINIERLRSDLALPTSVHAMATLKHRAEILNRPSSAWAETICSSNTYIEAIFARSLEVGDVAEIRTSQDESSKLMDLAFSDFARRLTPGERAIANDFVMLLSAAKSHGINLRYI